ncbi:MAG: hypothetical protein S4CHLAM37_14740 [Chlamydiia bacterium]|nr:hypothetical protein [Chlamydiia bacterium]
MQDNLAKENPMATQTQTFNAASQRYKIQHPIVDETTGTKVYKDPFNKRVITAEMPAGYDETHTLITGCCHKIFKDDELVNHLAPREVNQTTGAFGDDRVGHNQTQACTCSKPLDVRDIDLSIRQNLSHEPGVHNKYHFTPLRVTTNPDGSLDFVNPYTGRVIESIEDPITLAEYSRSADREDPNVAITRDGDVTFVDDDETTINLSRYKKIQNSATVNEQDKKDKRLAITGCCHAITEIGSMRAAHMTTCPKDRSNLIGSEYGYQPTYFQNINPFVATTMEDLLVPMTNLVGLLAMWIGLEVESGPLTGTGAAIWGLSRVIHEVQNIDPRLRTRADRVQRVAWKILDGIAAIAAGTLLASVFLTSTTTACMFTTLAVTLTVFTAALGVTARMPVPDVPPMPAAVV